jgi:hypothetical protein
VAFGFGRNAPGALWAQKVMVRRYAWYREAQQPGTNRAQRLVRCSAPARFARLRCAADKALPSHPYAQPINHVLPMCVPGVLPMCVPTAPLIPLPAGGEREKFSARLGASCAGGRVAQTEGRVFGRVHRRPKDYQNVIFVLMF